MKSVKQHRAAVIVMNVVIALLCIAAIAGYFLAPLFSIRVKVDLSAEDLKSMAGNASFEGVEVVYPDPDPVDVELSFQTLDFVAPVLSGDPFGSTETLISDKADELAASLTPVIRVTVEQVAEETIKDVIKEEADKIVNDQAQEVIEELIPEVTEEETKTILEEAEITESYIESKTEEALGILNSESATISDVQEFAVDTVKEVYEKLKGTGRPEFEELIFDAETEQEVRDVVRENLDAITDELGNLSTDEVVDRILEEIAAAMDGSGQQGSPVASLSASDAEETASDAETKLTENISASIKSALVTESNAQVFFYVTIGFLVLTAVSMLSWLYLLIKIFVKGFTLNPAVKLKAPILFLGWLPALVFFIIPTAALMIVNAFGGIGALTGGNFAMIGGVSFFTSGIYALAAAVLLILLFIPYAIVRKKLKLELTPRVTPQEEAAYIAANPALVSEQPVVKEHTVSDEPYTADVAPAAEQPEQELPPDALNEDAPADGGDAPDREGE